MAKAQWVWECECGAEVRTAGVPELQLFAEHHRKFCKVTTGQVTKESPAVLEYGV